MGNTKEENQKLIKEYVETKSKESFDKLVMGNQGLIGYVMKCMNFPLNIREDYVDLGNILLINAIKQYDLNKENGCSFSSYVYKCIRNGFLSHIKKEKMHCVRGSVFLDMSSNKNSDFYETFFHPDLIVSVAEIEKFIEDDSSSCNRKLLMMIIEEFSDIDKDVIFSTFELENHEFMTQKELAIKYNVTVAEISRRIIKCLKNIKKSLCVKHLDGETQLFIREDIECKLYLKGRGSDKEKSLKYFEALENLSEKEKDIVKSRLGLYKGGVISEKELAEKYNISIPVISKWFTTSIEKICCDVNGESKDNVKVKIKKKDCKKKM